MAAMPFASFFLPQPVDALPDDAQQHQILKNSIQRVKVIPAPEGLGVDHKEFQRRHSCADSPDADKIPLAVMGVGEALNSAEQEQRCGQPRQHTEPFRHNTRKFKKVVDVVHHHEHQRNGFERRARQTFVVLFAASHHPPYVCYTFSLRLNCVETIRKNTIACHKFYNKKCDPRIQQGPQRVQQLFCSFNGVGKAVLCLQFLHGGLQVLDEVGE